MKSVNSLGEYFITEYKPVKAIIYSQWFFVFFIFQQNTLAGANQPDDENITWIEIDVHGWTVIIDSSLIEGDTSILKRSLGLLGKELGEIKQAVPAHSLHLLQAAKIYFVKPIPESYYAVYFQLRYNYRKKFARRRGNIEVIPGRYIESSLYYKTWCLMHELAHAYHDRVFDLYDDKIKNIYDRAMVQRLYKRTRSHDFRYSVHGYATKNHWEYFAELSTAYFGRIEYFPFDRFDLKGYDPLGYKMIREVWGINDD